MNDMTNQPADHSSAPVHTSMLAHPDGRGKYTCAVSFKDGMITLTLRYVERPWLPLALFGRVIQTKMVRVAGSDVREATMMNDADGLWCTICRDDATTQRASILGAEWPVSLREEVRTEVDASLHGNSRGMSIQLKSRTTVAVALFVAYAIVSTLAGGKQTSAVAPGAAPSEASALPAMSRQAPVAPQLTASEAAGMSSAAVAQAAADAQSSLMPAKEAFGKASFISLRAVGTGGKSLIVWSDPLCPNCRDFDQKVLAKLPAGLGVYVVPVSFKHGSRPLVSYAACAPQPAERAARWKNLMSDEPKGLDVAQQCETGPAIADTNTSLFARAGLRATPTLMKPDGQVYEGDLQSAEAITAWLGK